MIVLNLGRREVGKTTLAYYSIRRCARRVIFDPRGLLPSDHRVTNPDGVVAAFAKPSDDFEVVITPDNDMRGCFDVACECVQYWMRRGVQNVGFLVDELRFIPRDSVTSPALDWILRCATRDSVIVVFTAHRPADVVVDIRAIADYWCVFHMTQKNDLDVITDRCGAAVAERVQRLRPRQFVSWNDAIGQMKIHSDPTKWHVALRSTAALPDTSARSALDALDGDPVSEPGLNFTD